VEPKAFRVFLLLLRNPRRLVTKDEFLNAVWDDCAVTDNSLTRSIATLRSLLGDDSREPRFIATIPTVGYRFLCDVVASEEGFNGSTTEETDLALEIDTYNRIGVSPVRKMVIYLPPGYLTSTHRYPVIYFLPNPFEENYRFDFDHRDAQGLFDRAIAEGVIKDFILVAVDMNTPLGTSWYVNSSVTGNWEDFMIQELLPYIYANFKTLSNRDSRGIAGIFIGGYGAIRFGMRHPDVFGSVYAMHPVGTGTGVSVSASLPKWDILVNAKFMDDVRKDFRTQIFTTMFQAHLPDPDKPPLFMDLLARQQGDQLTIDAKLMERFRNNFYLETMIGKYADNLNSLRGLKFDWSRNDANFDHVYANQAFTHKLNEFGIVHQAEEFDDASGEPDWGADGRFMTEVLPFFARYLVFDTSPHINHQ
jgi:DNA-binding winged helix-turn-helix (wHTH) protein/S-formylglutathione hydrolase FrmB